MALSFWEEEIAGRNLERVLSISFQLNDVTKKSEEGEIEKSITDDISYSEDFRIEKTGKEVKEKLKTELQTIITEKSAAVSKMEILVEAIGCMPMGKADRWRIQGFEKYLEGIPRQYTYAQIYPDKKNDGEKEYGSVYPNDYTPGFEGGITPTVTKETTDKMREYNQIASDYIGRCVEEMKLKTVIDNLSDAKKLKLSPQLAAQLGF